MTSISSIWTRLDPTVQQWLLENPGCVVLPRTMANRTATGMAEELPVDEHGEHWLSPEDITFLKARRRALETGGSTGPTGAEVRPEVQEEALRR
ncbi:hypothetical protein ACX80J_03085 [Arthrobacter sp. MDB2-24]